MAAENGNDSNRVISAINVTPLVDIMLVLLIVFMVTARLVTTPETVLPLELPKASRGESIQAIFSIALLADGGTVVGGERVRSDDAILPLGRAFREEHPGVKAVIQADGHVLHERVVHVMDLLSQADIAQIAFGVVVDAAAATRAP